MSLGSMPALFSASTTRVMAAVFLASTSFAVGAWLSTPALTVTLSGVDLMVPLPDMVMVRLGGSLSSASATWPTARAAAARKASVAKRYLRAKDVMGSPASLGVQLYEPARSIPTGQAPLLRSVGEDEEFCYEAEIGNARFSLKYRRDKNSSWPGLSRPSTSLIFWGENRGCPRQALA